MEFSPDPDNPSGAIVLSDAATDEPQGIASLPEDPSKQSRHEAADRVSFTGAKRPRLQPNPHECGPLGNVVTTLGYEGTLASGSGAHVEDSSTASFVMDAPPLSATSAPSAKSILLGVGPYFGGVLSELKTQYRQSSDHGVETRVGSEADGPFDSIDEIQAQIANASASASGAVILSAGLLAAEGAGPGGAADGSGVLNEDSVGVDGKGSGFAADGIGADTSNIGALENNAVRAGSTGDDEVASVVLGNTPGDMKDYSARRVNHGTATSDVVDAAADAVTNEHQALRGVAIMSSSRAIDSGLTVEAEAVRHPESVTTDCRYGQAAEASSPRARQSRNMEFPEGADKAAVIGENKRHLEHPKADERRCVGSTELDTEGMGALDLIRDPSSSAAFINSENFTAGEAAGVLTVGRGADAGAKAEIPSNTLTGDLSLPSMHFAKGAASAVKMPHADSAGNGVAVHSLAAPNLNIQAPSAETQADVLAGRNIGEHDARAAIASATVAASVISPPVGSATDAISVPAGSLSFGQAMVFGQHHVEHGPSAIPSSAKDDSHTCGECGIAFHNSNALKYHSEKFHGPEAQGTGDATPPRPRPFPCLTCGRAFLRTGDLNRHRNVVHNRVRKSTCPICMAGFGHAGDRNRHVVRVHEKGEFHQCELCAATFGSKAAYTAHLKIHSRRLESGTPFACLHCSKAFATDVERDVHSTEIHVVNKFVCRFELCEESFPTARSLKSHVHLKHEQVQRCQLCPATFRKSEELLAHTGNRHSREGSKTS